MTTEAKLLTAEDLFKLSDDGYLFELLDGKLVELMPPGGMHGKVSFKVSQRLGNHVESGNLGEVFTNDTGIILRRNPDRVCGPDVCFIARDRLPAEGIPVGYLEVVPDLIVEVVSPNDTAVEVQQKIEEWLRAGARLVWAIYPQTRSVVAYRSLEAIRIYAESDTIDAKPVLPDFQVAVSDLFA